MRSSEQFPPFYARIASVWYRHYRVYTKSLISNGLPPFFEPLIFLAGIGLGMSRYIVEMDGIPYITFLATGLPITAAMYTAAFECSYGTFIRLEFDRVYEGMLSSPLSVENLLLGEILWAGTKGFFFSFAVILVVAIFGTVPLPLSFLTPTIGFFAGTLFASLSLFVTSFVGNINHFNFYFTGFLSPMFFFSGIVFPLSDLPNSIRIIAELFPLTHLVRLTRGIDFWELSAIHLYDTFFIVVFTIGFGLFAIRRLKRKLLM